MKHLLFSLFFLYLYSCRTIPISFQTYSIPTKDPSNIRVLLLKTSEDIELKSGGKIQVFDANGEFLKSTAETLVIKGTQLLSPVMIQFESNQFTLKSVQYRGTIRIIPKETAVFVVNVLPIEEYLASVVPSEMSPSWPMDALKAQAVCARTFAIKEKISKSNDLFDVVATTNSQAYKGMSVEHQRTNQAIQETKGQILTYKSEPIQSFFHANSGGFTEDSESVWGRSLPYLKPVASPYCKEDSGYAWKKFYSFESLSLAFQKLGLGEISELEILNRTQSNRIESVRLVGTEKSVQLSGNEFRKMLGFTSLPSLRFAVTKLENGFEMKGFGKGHGVGLSQWGSMGMAKEQYTYKEILAHYFKDVSFANVIY